jgi:hypothetical protein
MLIVGFPLDDPSGPYQQDRASWRARLAQYVSARNAVVAPRDGWLGLDDEDDWTAMLLSRWPVLRDDFVRGPPEAQLRKAISA